MKIVIEGAGEVGSHLAKMLRSEGNEVTVIDADQQRISALSSYSDVEAIVGNRDTFLQGQAPGRKCRRADCKYRTCKER